MSDYAVHIKVRNGIIEKLMENAGIKNAAELSRASGVSQSEIGEILNFKKPPLTKSGEFSKAVERLSLFFKILYPLFKLL